VDILTLIKALVMGIVEGLTEFLPVSSTGHLIVTSSLIGFHEAIGGKDASNTFEIFIQLGAVIAVVLYFIRDLADLVSRAFSDARARGTLLNVLVAFLPAAVIGVLFSSEIKALLFNPVTVAVALIVGGLLMLWIESRVHRADTTHIESISLRQALQIGLAQVVAMIPGTSRSMMTLVGGLVSGLDRSTALRFSFYLSIPTLGAATVYDFVRNLDQIQPAALPAFAVGLVASFVVALGVIKFFLGYVARHDLKPFAYYRILAGVVILALFGAGLVAV
jgi:undecaprenyl-diphosphatase